MDAAELGGGCLQFKKGILELEKTLGLSSFNFRNEETKAHRGNMTH